MNSPLVGATVAFESHELKTDGFDSLTSDIPGRSNPTCQVHGNQKTHVNFPRTITSFSAFQSAGAWLSGYINSGISAPAIYSSLLIDWVRTSWAWVSTSYLPQGLYVNHGVI